MLRKLFTNGVLLAPGGRFVPGSLVVEGGVITQVIPAGEIPTDEMTSGVELVDLCGRHVVPGFIDSHFHLMALALKRLRCDLGGTSSAGDAVERLVQWLKSADPARPVIGVDWDQSGWDDPSFPTRAMLDAVSEDRPVFARRICGHVGVANGAFLRLLVVPDLEEFIDRDAGLVTEDAVYAANRLCAPPDEAIATAVEAAVGELHQLGVTGIHDIVDAYNVDAYLDGVRASRRPIRIDALFHVAPDEFGQLRERSAGIDEDRFRPVGIKVYSDGSLGGRTAAVSSSYADAQSIGEFLLDEEFLARTLRRCCDLGITCAVHAIGDRALRAVSLEMMKFPSDTDLFRIEHAEMAGWDEIRLLGQTPVYVSMQPNFVGGMYESRLGRERGLRCNRFGALRDAGVPYMFGSDGMPPGPLFGIRGATHHPIEDERLGLTEAICRYTADPARFGAHARDAGELAVGNLADIVVLTGDPSTGDPDVLGVFATYVGGDRVYPWTNDVPPGPP
jgi:predicted amidohydrolase YtcJ